MKILFWLEPHFDLMVPGVMKTWMGWFERIAYTLCQSSGDVDFRIVGLDSAAANARADCLGECLILLSQAELLAQWRLEGNAFIQLENDRVPSNVCAELLLGLNERLGNFEPDIVFLLNQQPWLRRGFKNALFVNIEMSWTSRAPYPASWQLDISGAGKGRVLANYADLVLGKLTRDERAEEFVEKTRSIARERLTNPTANQFVLRLREKFSTVTLLPIGALDHSDGRTLFFAALDKFLGDQREDTAIVLTQHPDWQLLNCDQLAYLFGKYPYVQDAGEIGSQYLLPLVDDVIGDFGTVATQCLFFDVGVVSVRRKLENFPIDMPLLNPLVDILSAAGAEQRGKMLYWLLSFYSVPEARLFDGAWMSRFLHRAIEAVRVGQPWSAYQEPIATIKDWAESEWRDIPTKFDSEARIYISEIIDGLPQIYTESRGSSRRYPVSSQRQLIRLPMPANMKPLASIRLDPANCQVALWFHRLELVRADGSIIWRWCGDVEAFTNTGGFVIRNGAQGLLILSLDEDPHFDLALPREVLAGVAADASLIVELTPQPLHQVAVSALYQDDQLIAELRSELKSVYMDTPSVEAGATKPSVHLQNDVQSVMSQFKNRPSGRDQTFAEQSGQILATRDELLRAKAQLDLLKDLILDDCEQDRL